MIVKILGIIDLLTAILFWLFGIFHIIPPSVIVFLAFILLIKGLIFVISEHIASALDIAIAAVMFITVSFTIPNVFIFIAAILLIQKGVVSLL
jgi:hypothetical protein